MADSLIRIAVVGHTNTGKTSLLRTLTRDTRFGEVADSQAPRATSKARACASRAATRWNGSTRPAWKTASRCWNTWSGWRRPANGWTDRRACAAS